MIAPFPLDKRSSIVYTIISYTLERIDHLLLAVAIAACDVMN